MTTYYEDVYGDTLEISFTSQDNDDIPNHVLITCVEENSMAAVAFDLDELKRVIHSMQEIYDILEARMRGDK